MRKWLGIPLSFLFVLSLFVPAWANEELHPGGRLFFPLWDVSTPNRLTFIIVTREALNENQQIKSTLASSANTTVKKWYLSDSWPYGNCQPRGPEGNSDYINRTDLGGTSLGPNGTSDAKGVFVDDVHFEYYGKSCNSSDETVHMSCGDIDLFLLASYDNPNRQPRIAFADVAAEGRGALDVHRAVNTTRDPTQRELENALMGHAIISDLAEGWAAVYPAAAAKATYCPLCNAVDGGTPYGYEAYPMEVYLPWAFADLWNVPGGNLRNVLSLWGPALMPGGNLSDTSISLSWKWWDGRERWKEGSKVKHSVIAPLGGPGITGLDSPLDTSGFVVTNFTCGHSDVGTTTGAGSEPMGSTAENDGFPRAGNASGGGQGCTPGTSAGAIATADPQGGTKAHTSDNFENDPDVNTVGHSIQQSTSIGWWRFQLRRDQHPPFGFNPAFDHSGRGLVGVVLSTASNTSFLGVGDSWRLWHKDPCGLAQSGVTYGPPHLRDFYLYRSAANSGVSAGDLVALFNALPGPPSSLGDVEGRACEGDPLVK